MHLALAGFAGCGAPGPIEGADLERLKADVKARRPRDMRITAVGPRALAAGGAEAGVVMPFESHGKKVAEFPLYDGYFKAAFVVANELRALGIPAALAPEVWTARLESVRFDTRGLDDQAVEQVLGRLGAHDDVQQIWKLKPEQRRELLVSRLVLIAAQSGLPPADRAKKVTAREIRNRFFGPNDRRVARTMIEVEAAELDAAAEEGGFGGERRGRARLRLKLWRATDSYPKPRLDKEFACAARADGTGVAFEPVGASYTFTLAPDDPLELAVRGCVRAFVAEALPLLK